MRWWVWLLLLVFLGGLVVGGILGYPYFRLYRLKSAPALVLEKGKKTFVHIPTGSKLADVAALLSKANLLKSAEDFRFFAKAKNYRGRRIVPGRYQVRGGMTYNRLLNHLRAGNGRLSVKVSFHFVRDLADLAKKVAPQIEPTEAQLLACMKKPALMKKYGFDAKTFSTMFLPDTYRMNWAISACGFVERMAKGFRKFWRGKRMRRAKQLKLRPSQVSILASIVQAEQSKKPDEWPKIAGLYLNRLKRKMKLEADPTVKFALGKPGLRRILFKHLKVQSPYNTYLHHGLPPGPLRIPAKSAIDAVLYHQRHPYIYMCAKPEYSGYHNFAKTLRKHNANARQYHRWLKKEGIR